jgi:hypothetical protein
VSTPNRSAPVGANSCRAAGVTSWASPSPATDTPKAAASSAASTTSANCLRIRCLPFVAP